MCLVSCDCCRAIVAMWFLSHSSLDSHLFLSVSAVPMWHSSVPSHARSPAIAFLRSRGTCSAHSHSLTPMTYSLTRSLTFLLTDSATAYLDSHPFTRILSLTHPSLLSAFLCVLLTPTSSPLAWTLWGRPSSHPASPLSLTPVSLFTPLSCAPSQHRDGWPDT